MNLFLIGYRGTGKTTLGRALAQHLGWQFVDMDDTLSAESGASIVKLVRRQGWEYFREQEHSLLTRLAAGRRQVVSTGGGVILRPDNVTTLRSSGTVLWLRARTDTIRGRLAGDERNAAFRPALTGLDPAAEIETTLGARTPLYQAAMDLAVDTDDRGVQEVFDEIVAALANFGFKIHP
jgi:shikimate kinase